MAIDYTGLDISRAKKRDTKADTGIDYSGVDMAGPDYSGVAEIPQVGQFAPIQPELSSAATGGNFLPPTEGTAPNPALSPVQGAQESPTAPGLLGDTAISAPPTRSDVGGPLGPATLGPLSPGFTPDPYQQPLDTIIGEIPPRMAGAVDLISAGKVTPKNVDSILEGVTGLKPEEFVDAIAMATAPAAVNMRKYTTQVLLKSPKAQQILRDVVPQAMKDRVLPALEESARKDLQSLGLSKKVAQQALDASKAGTVITAVQNSKAIFGKRGIDPLVRAEIAKDSADIISSLGMTKTDAAQVLKWMVKQPFEPLPEITELAKGVERGKFTLNPGSADAPVQLTRTVSKFVQENKFGIWHVLHPESILSLEAPANNIYKLARITEEETKKQVAQYVQKVKDILEPFDESGRNIIRMVLNGDLKPISGKRVPIPPKIMGAATQLRDEVLNPIARFKYMNPATGQLESLPEQGRIIKDYFPHFFDGDTGIPFDIVLSRAQQLARVRSMEGWLKLSDAERGKFIRVARVTLQKTGVPNSYYFGNISKSRLANADPKTAKTVEEQLMAYVYGAMRKAHMDAFYKEVDPLLGRIQNPELQKYAQEYLDDFRGVPRGKGHAIGDVARTLQAVAKLGLNATSSLLNLTQTSINTYAVTGGDTLRKAILLRFQPAGRKLLADSGVFLDVPKHEWTSAVLPKAVGKTSDMLLWLFDLSESFNREIAYLAGYLKAYKEFPKASAKALQHAGRAMVDRTQFVFSQSGRPAFYGTPMGATLGQFKLFGLNQLKFIRSLKGPEISRFALSTALHGGAGALPGVNSLPMSLFGIQTAQSVKDKDLPSFAENFILGGLPRAMGVSLAQDVGVGFLPDLTQLSQVAPVAASLPITMAKNWTAVQGDVPAQEKIITELIRTLPAGVSAERVRQAYLAYKRGGLELGPAGELKTTMTKGETALAAVAGGKMTKKAKERETQDYLRSVDQKAQFQAGRFYHDARIAIANQNPEALNAAFEYARKAEIFDILHFDQALFRPSILKSFMSLPQAKRALVLTQNPQFRDVVLKGELEKFGQFLGALGKMGAKKTGETGIDYSGVEGLQ